MTNENDYDKLLRFVRQYGWDELDYFCMWNEVEVYQCVKFENVPEGFFVETYPTFAYVKDDSPSFAFVRETLEILNCSHKE